MTAHFPDTPDTCGTVALSARRVAASRKTAVLAVVLGLIVRRPAIQHGGTR
jgi:hypothetical protein